jgi:NADH-quinone oxidoreductase subunit J
MLALALSQPACAAAAPAGDGASADRAGSLAELAGSLRGKIAVAVALAAVAMWCMIPPSGKKRRAAGVVLGAIALGLLATLLPAFAGRTEAGVFWTIAVVTVVAAAATVTSHNPVYCALWFALSLLGTAGLMLLGGAQFLGVATVVVYAGAIVVTFLFVLMLAQPDGSAVYDRIGWGTLPSMLACAAGAILVGVLTFALGDRHGGEPAGADVATTSDAAGAAVDDAAARDVLNPHHVARFGGELFTRHLVAVEVAGLLLLVALVGAAAIVAHGRRSSARETQG